MMERFMKEADLLIRDVDANVVPDAANTRLDYMWKERSMCQPPPPPPMQPPCAALCSPPRPGPASSRRHRRPPTPCSLHRFFCAPTQVGRYDLRDSLVALDDVYRGTTLVALEKTALMQTLLLIFLFLTAAAIVLFLFRPFQARIRAEMALVANALSQLPLDVDVETMLVQAIMSKGGGIDATTAEEFGLAGVKQLRRRSVDAGKSPRTTRDALSSKVPAIGVGFGGDMASDHSF